MNGITTVAAAAPEAAVRSLLFAKASEAHKRALEALTAAGEALAAGNALGVIGSLEGTTEQFDLMRSMMLLVRDQFSTR